MTLLDYMVPLQISDFGMTREVESEMYYMLGKGTVIPVKWTAPEAILFRKYTTKSDIWSYGMLMYEIWSLGHKPFESNTVQEVSCSWLVWFLQCTEHVSWWLSLFTCPLVCVLGYLCVHVSLCLCVHVLMPVSLCAPPMCMQMVQLLDAHYCLPPPPGCPREVYSVMVDCW